MKMSFPIFLGVLVVMAGLSILLEAMFRVHLPFVRTAFGLFFLFLGVRILFGAWAPTTRDLSGSGSVVMSDQHFVPNVAASYLKYDIVFGRGVVDLTELPRPEKPMVVEINSIFSSTQVTIDPSWPIAVEGNAAFGEVRMPDESMAAFGTARYQTAPEALVRLRVNAVFGNCHVIEGHGHAPATTTHGSPPISQLGH